MLEQPPPPPPPPPPVRVESIGRSVEGRPIGLSHVGDPAAPRKVLVIGCVHGDEPAGRKIVRRLVTMTPPAGVELLLVQNLDPDGFVHGRRGNAHGVDLNRNSAQGWRRLHGPFFSGDKPFSEPESRAIRAVILRVRPTLSIWYHQPLEGVDRPDNGSAAPARRYARLTGLPFRPLGSRPGSLSRWQNARVRAGSSFVVELPRGRLDETAARRHAAAVLAIAARP